ncbi:hypothetical protein HDU87_007835 [Geranomyces variabilis]|uniref:BZIP domain-containing protein n=1 Tax=Geranomyces variabilis TaxID=109894 RepID=A0AAD5TF42_9FUNG|nr:hypothetical protein HDU87_007835 [Geranomyces variabilis]
MSLPEPSPNPLLSDFGGLLAGTDSEVQTPTRFLQECVNFKVTPGWITRYMSGDFNPFEQSFKDKFDPSGLSAEDPAAAAAAVSQDASSVNPNRGTGQHQAAAALDQTLWNPAASVAAGFPETLAVSMADTSQPFIPGVTVAAVTAQEAAAAAATHPIGAPAAAEGLFAEMYQPAQQQFAVSPVNPALPVVASQFGGLHIPTKRQRTLSSASELPLPAAPLLAAAQPYQYPPPSIPLVPIAQTQPAALNIPVAMPHLSIPMHMGDVEQSVQPAQLHGQPYYPSAQQQPQLDQHMQQHQQHQQQQQQHQLSVTGSSVGESSERRESPSTQRSSAKKSTAASNGSSKRRSSSGSNSTGSARASSSVNASHGHNDRHGDDDNEMETDEKSGSPTGGSRSTKRKSAPTEDEQDEKRKRFLERNRVAASKCRMKKKQWLQDLETKSAEIGQSNRQLQNIVTQLKEEVMVLKSQLLLHRNCTCNVIQQYISTSPQFSQQLQNSSSEFSHQHNAQQPQHLQAHPRGPPPP